MADHLENQTPVVFIEVETKSPPLPPPIKRVSAQGFAAELAAAGLSDVPMSWDLEGRITFADGVPTAKRNAVNAALAAHDPKNGDIADKWEAIKAERDRRTELGGYKVGQYWFHSNQFSRSQQLGLVLMGANIPANLQWKTMSGEFVTMTQTLAQQIMSAAAASDIAIFYAAEKHKAAMRASANPANYDFSTGWPKVYGE